MANRAMDILIHPPTPARTRANLLLVLLLAFTTSAAPADAALESTVKAAYLGKFGLFTTWPEGAFASAKSSVNICLLGDDPFAGQLERNLANQSIQNRPIRIRRLGNADQHSGCHITFINEPDLPRRHQLLQTLRESPTLTVTDIHTGSEGAAATGIINFVITDKRVRFDIDDAAAAQAGLTISSRLLLLALTVKPRP